MPKNLAVVFFILSFLANQAFALSCAEECLKGSSHSKIHSEISSVHQDVQHHDKSGQLNCSQSQESCGATICSQSYSLTEVNIGQVDKKDSNKKLLDNYQFFAHDNLSNLGASLFYGSAPPISSKIRLHLRLQRLII